MFVHHGDSRTHQHNLKIASLLSFVAGYVNVVGFISVHRLTTNVTGHFAFFVDDIFKLKFYESFIFFLYILFFFMGAMVSNILIEIVRKHSARNIYILPVAIEIMTITLIAIMGKWLYTDMPNLIAIGLLFAMGIQNAMVTKISNAVVRTTHLTGLFTDLGIEISQLLFYKNELQRQQLLSNIQLRTTIIFFFFIGGILAGILYNQMMFSSLFIPVMLLIYGVIYDRVQFRFLKWRSK